MGNLRARGANTWQLRVHTGGGRYRTRTFKGGKRDALKALARFEAAVHDGPISAPANAGAGPRTFDDLWARYEQVKLPKLEVTTRPGYRSKWRCYLQPVLGQVALTDLGVEDVEALFNDGALTKVRRKKDGTPAKGHGQPVSAWTRYQCQTVLRSMLSAAVRWKWLDGPHVVEQAELPGPPKQTTVRAPAAKVVRQLLAAAHAESVELATFVRISAVKGPRRGEVSGIRWSDIDWAASTVHIGRAAKLETYEVGDGTNRRRVVVGDTKTHAERRLHLDPTTLALLRRVRRRNERRAALCDIALADDAFVFAADIEGAEPVSPDTWTARWRHLRNAHGASQVRLHDLRHFVGFNLVPLGIKAASDELGHSRITTTAIYQQGETNPTTTALIAGIIDGDATDGDTK